MFPGLDDDLSRLSERELEDLARQLAVTQEQDRKENQLLYYRPVSERAAMVHQSTARYVGVGGGNRSAKTSTCIVHAIALATGVFPRVLNDTFARQFRGPINVRIVVESHTAILQPVILPKLQWWQWSGDDRPGGERGHWGWIPKTSLREGEWSKSWSEQNRLLRILCRDPERPEHILGESMIQMMCLRGDQRVRMADWTWRPISQISEGDLVMHPSGVPTKVTKTFRYPDAPLLRVRCWGGREIVCTPNHRHPLADGRVVQTDELVIGDIIRTNRDAVADPYAYERRMARLHVFRPGVTAVYALADWELGWGAIAIGDGCLRRADFGFTATPGNRVLCDLPPLPPNTRLHQCPYRPREWRLPLVKGRRGNPLVTKLKAWGLWGLLSHEKFVPDDIFRQSPKARAFFLRHLWNTDGTINQKGRQACYTSTSRTLAYDVKYLLWGLDIPASVGDVPGQVIKIGEGTKPYMGRASFRVVVSGGAFDRFLAAILGKRFSGVPLKHYQKDRSGKVRSIEDAGREPAYCIEVDAEDHLFIVDGLATHNSSDQLPAKFASAQFHMVILDEKTDLAIFRENEARVMSVDGRIFLAMTWPDDPSIPVDWIYDEIYEKAQPGPKKSPDHDWFELWTTDNRFINQGAVAAKMTQWDEATKGVRIYGRPVRFSNRIHPLFTDLPQQWCLTCHQTVLGAENECPACGGSHLTEYCHVQEFDWEGHWPVLFILDPHPRRPHMFLWLGVDPQDDLWVIADGAIEGGVPEVKVEVDVIEETLGLSVALRLIDPNMGRSPANAVRGVTWQDEFDGAGLYCELAEDSDIGRGRINEYLKPDERTLRPRLHVHARARDTAHQMLRYTWGEHRRSLEKELKQIPRPKYDDYPSMLKYALNYDPQFSQLRSGPEVKRWAGARRGAY